MIFGHQGRRKTKQADKQTALIFCHHTAFTAEATITLEPLDWAFLVYILHELASRRLPEWVLKYLYLSKGDLKCSTFHVCRI